MATGNGPEPRGRKSSATWLGPGPYRWRERAAVAATFSRMPSFSDRRVSTIFAFVLASGLCVALLLVRIVESGSSGYRFLVWNLVLAWIPFLLALALYDANRRGAARPCQLLVAGGWLLFLPNAPYIVTDFLHIGVIPGAPIWFDASLVATFAGTGVMLGLASLLLVQSVVSRSWGHVWSWLVLFPVLGLCSLGIALGRIARFNSWDAVSQPGAILRVLGDKLLDPETAVRGIALVGALTVSLAVGYLVLYAVAGLVPRRERSIERD
jgi:uncharacterized membrane protein